VTGGGDYLNKTRGESLGATMRVRREAVLFRFALPLKKGGEWAYRESIIRSKSEKRVRGSVRADKSREGDRKAKTFGRGMENHGSSLLARGPSSTQERVYV